MVLFFIKTLNGGFVFYECYHYIPVVGIILLLYHHIVAVQNARLNHALAPYGSMKLSSPRRKSAGSGKVSSMFSTARIGCPAVTFPTMGTSTISLQWTEESCPAPLWPWALSGPCVSTLSSPAFQGGRVPWTLTLSHTASHISLTDGDSPLKSSLLINSRTSSCLPDNGFFHYGDNSFPTL